MMRLPTGAATEVEGDASDEHNRWLLLKLELFLTSAGVALAADEDECDAAVTAHQRGVKGYRWGVGAAA